MATTTVVYVPMILHTYSTEQYKYYVFSSSEHNIRTHIHTHFKQKRTNAMIERE